MVLLNKPVYVRESSFTFKDVEKIFKPSGTVMDLFDEIYFDKEYIHVFSNGSSVLAFQFKWKDDNLIIRHPEAGSRVYGIYWREHLCKDPFLRKAFEIYLRPKLLEKLTYSKEFDINEEDLFKYVEDKKKSNPHPTGNYIVHSWANTTTGTLSNDF